MKPKITPYYETTSGTAVKTLSEWKQAEMVIYLTQFDPMAGADRLIVEQFADQLIANPEPLVSILSVREPKGRPAGAKDRPPRKSRKAAQTPTPDSDLDGPKGAAQ